VIDPPHFPSCGVPAETFSVLVRRFENLPRVGMHHLIRMLCAISLLGLVTSGSCALAQEPTLQGVFVATTADRSGINAAIEQAAAKMNWLVAGVARGRLSKTNPLYHRIEIRNSGSQISVQYDQRKPILMPADGQLVKWTREDGEVFDVSAQIVGTQLTQTYKAQDGQRVNVFSLQPDGTLRLDVTITSPQLPSAVSYTLNYTRK